MTPRTDIRRDHNRNLPLLPALSRTRGGGVTGILDTALALTTAGVPVLPLSADKRPFANCPACRLNFCGGRPGMKTPGPCACPAPCHAWAAATTNPTVITSPLWRRAWDRAGAIGYHPGGAGVTVVDLDNPAAVDWARATLPATTTVATTRGEHWIYSGTVRSVNRVRDSVDIKSSMSYARWLGPGTGAMAAVPSLVHELVEKKPAAGPAPRPVTVPAQAGGGRCPHRSPVFLERGIAMAEQRITAATSAVHNTVYATFLAVLSAHGRCGCLTDTHIGRLFAAAQAKGESPRHCTAAWSNAATTLGM